jgi:hypothetical protein
MGSRYVNTGGGQYGERGRAAPNRRTFGTTVNAGRDYAGRDTVRPPTSVVSQVFGSARDHIDALAADGRDTTPLQESVTSIEAEVARGDAADGAVVARALAAIAALVPELAAAVAAGLLDPTAGVAVDVQSAARWVLGR